MIGVSILSLLKVVDVDFFKHATVFEIHIAIVGSNPFCYSLLIFCKGKYEKQFTDALQKSSVSR